MHIKRDVPVHPLAIFDGCDEASIGEAMSAIGEAIELGAPLYNQGNHEACFRIYEGASSKLERESACKGVREAFGAGLLRASTLDDALRRGEAYRQAGADLVLLSMAHKPEQLRAIGERLGGPLMYLAARGGLANVEFAWKLR